MKNEKRLIDAEAVRHKINAFAASVVYRGNAEMFNGKDTCNPYEYTRGYERGILDAQKIVCGEETVDAAPVVHGRWIWSEENECWVCSNCEMSALNNYCGNSVDSNYCPNCGAKMDGGNEDG